jgi:hypothetical protein
VRGFESAGNLPRDWQRLIQGEHAPRDAIVEGHAVDEFHDECAPGTALFEPVDLCDVRVIQRREQQLSAT